MSTKTSPHALFTGLVDDAAMFPPGNASAETAIREHLRHRRSWYSSIVGPLLVHSGRWEEFRTAHQEAGSPDLSVVVIAATRRPDRVGRGLTVVGFETPAADPLELPVDKTPTAVELVEPSEYDAVLAKVATARAAGLDVIAKYRTGGTSATAFPPEDAVAGVISSAVARGVPMKFTAGLHAALRHTDAVTGFEHHGFLNLLAAVRAAHAGAHVGALTHVLATRRAEAMVSCVTQWGVDEIALVRRTFTSFGCCGVCDPVAAAVTLGLIAEDSR